jgi:hypothetical protein
MRQVEPEHCERVFLGRKLAGIGLRKRLTSTSLLSFSNTASSVGGIKAAEYFATKSFPKADERI